MRSIIVVSVFVIATDMYSMELQPKPNNQDGKERKIRIHRTRKEMVGNPPGGAPVRDPLAGIVPEGFLRTSFMYYISAEREEAQKLSLEFEERLRSLVHDSEKYQAFKKAWAVAKTERMRILAEDISSRQAEALKLVTDNDIAKDDKDKFQEALKSDAHRIIQLCSAPQRHSSCCGGQR